MEKGQNNLGNGRGFAYVCKVCGKEGLAYNIKDHIEANHLEGVVIPCNLCGKTVRSRVALNQHVRRYHKYWVGVSGQELPWGNTTSLCIDSTKDSQTYGQESCLYSILMSCIWICSAVLYLYLLVSSVDKVKTGVLLYGVDPLAHASWLRSSGMSEALSCCWVIFWGLAMYWLT